MLVKEDLSINSSGFSLPSLINKNKNTIKPQIKAAYTHFLHDPVSAFNTTYAFLHLCTVGLNVVYAIFNHLMSLVPGQFGYEKSLVTIY